jgi:mono/diheme cytochrome c family protein
MPSSAQRDLKMRKILFAMILVLICITLLYATHQKNSKWVVPEEAKRLKNPLQPSATNLNAAAGLYKDECAECHGEHGKGDGPKAKAHDLSPSDLTDLRHMNTVTDGEIFYQISEGRKPMPRFKNRMTEDQRWQLVLFVRTFSQKISALESKSGGPAVAMPEAGTTPATPSKN